MLQGCAKKYRDKDMGKTLGRDVQVLLKILTYMEKIQGVLKRNNCRTSADFTSNEDCMDICSFCVLQIDSLSRQLTRDSFDAINFICAGNLVPVRNMIAHDYVKLNRYVLYSFVQDICSNKSFLQIEERIKYCQENRKN